MVVRAGFVERRSIRLIDADADWERAVEEFYGILAEVASRSSAITCGKLAGRLTSATLVPNAPALYKMPDDVPSRAFTEVGSLLSAVVVRKTDGRRGPGFCWVGSSTRL